MKQYTFTGVKGDHTVVTAENETVARDLAMKSRWGMPDGVVVLTKYDDKGKPAPIQYSGFGLILLGVEEVKVVKRK
jgi:hypothetical protein